MPTFLRIVNDGLIEVEDLTLIGSSTKRGVAGKIGEFGSGNKFSLAWYFRNDCIPVIFRGLEQMKIDTKVVLHRDTPVHVITVNDIDTSITTNMGPKWNGWMALRETVSNALDEGGFEMKTLVNPEMIGEEGKTIYYIQMNKDLEKVVSNFNHYFSMDRTPIFSNKLGEIFERSSDRFNLYRQGIRCYDSSKDILVDVNLFDIEINESRLTDEGHFDTSMRNFFLEGVSHEVMHLLLSSGYHDYMAGRFSAHNLEVIKDMVTQGKTFGSKSMSKLAGLLGTSTFDYVIPNIVYDQLVREGVIEGIDSNNQLLYKEVPDAERLAEVKYFLSAFNIKADIKNVITGKFQVAAWEGNNRVLVNVNCLKTGSMWSNEEVAHNILRSIPLEAFTTLI